MSGLFISQELRKTRCEIRRTEKELTNVSEQLYQVLFDDFNKAITTKGKDYITYTADRKIGKTHNLIKLAIEYECPIIVHDSLWANSLKKFIKNNFGKEVQVVSYRGIGNRLDGIRCDIILKDEMVAIDELRKTLNETGKGYVNVVGIN
jgi:hypothetical protein